MDKMDSGLIAAFQGLQLDPANDQQTVALEALCWKHILQQTSFYWLQQAQTGTLPLVRELQTDVSPRETMYIYDHTLNRLTFKFVETYAGALWPSAEDQRSHLTSNANTNFELKAPSLHTRVNASARARLEHDLGHPCTEQIIVAESVLGRRVREFLKELVRTRAAPLVDGYSAEQALQSVLKSAGATAPVTTTGYCRTTPARIPCPHPGCLITFAGSEALTTHLNFSHAIFRPSRPDTTTDLQMLPASNASIVQGDTPTSVLRSRSAWGPDRWVDRQIMDSTSPIPNNVTSSYQAASVVDPNPNNTSMHSPMILSDDEGGEGSVSGSLSMLPDHRADKRTEAIAPDSSSIAALHEAGPIDGSNHYTADVLSLSGSDEEEDIEDDVSGLLCPRAGCRLRFPNWASFEEHAQRPHNDSPRASNGGETATTKAVADFDDLQETGEVFEGKARWQRD